VTSEAVLFLDDDDLLVPEALSVLVPTLLQAPDIVGAVGGLRLFDERSHAVVPGDPPVIRDMWPEAVWGWVAHTGQTLFRTDAVREAGGFRPGLVVAEDRDLWLRLTRMGRVAFSSAVVLDHRLHPAQWRPLDVRGIEEEITRRHLETLPQADRDVGERIVRARRIFDRSSEAWQEGRPRSAFVIALGFRATPARIWFSWRLRRIWPPFFGRIIAGGVLGRRGIDFARRVLAVGRSVRGVERWEPATPQQQAVEWPAAWTID